MASSGKKNKKAKKQVSMTLEQFLKDVPQTPIRKSTTDWADIVEDESDAFEPRPKQNIVLPTAPRAARVPVSNEANIPQDPPYVAYISNLTYDVEEKDLSDFFKNLKIANIRLPREDREPGKLRGFGYVEFADRNNLIQAMTLSDTSLKGRRMRIEVSTNDEKKRMGGGMGGNRNMDMQRDRPERETSGDWRSGPRQESSFQESAPIERRSGFNNRDTYDPPSNNKPGAWRDAANDRPPAFRDNRDNRDDRRGGGGRDRDYGGGRRNYNDRERDEGFSRRNFSRDDDNRSESSEPRTRPKLILAPRKEPKEPNAAEPAPPPAAPAAPSIFGAAKPVDTSARERQIEERLAKERELKAAEIKKEAELVKAKEDAEKEIVRPPVVENSWRTSREETNNQDTKKDLSPIRRRDSPRRDNSRRRDSPKRAGGASDSPQRGNRRDSPSRRRGDSPSSRRRDSPLRKRDGSPRRRDGSPIRRRDSPQRRRDGPLTSRRNDKKSKYYKKAVMYALRSIAKHNVDLAQTIINYGGLESMILCMEDFDYNVKVSAVWAIGYVARLSKHLAQATIDAGAIPLLILCLQEPEIQLKQVTASTLTDIAKHGEELAQTIVDCSGSLVLLSRSLDNQDVKLKCQVLNALDAIATHNTDLAEACVEAEIFPIVLLHICPNEYGGSCPSIHKAACNLVRDIVKHSFELAQLIVNQGGIAALLQTLDDNSKLSAYAAIGYIAGHSEQLALVVAKSGAVATLSQCLQSTKDQYLLATCAWALGQIDDRRSERGGRSDPPLRGDRDRGERDPRPSQRNTHNNTSNKGRFDDKPHKERNNVETKERNVEDRMPKLKEQEAPNFAASNKFAFLETEDTSD